jgi:hypothetical protein
MDLLRSRDAQYDELADDDTVVTDEGVARIDEDARAENNGE